MSGGGSPVLVVAPNWLGDAVMSLPMMRALRQARRDRPLLVLARRGPAAVYRASGTAVEVLPATGSLWRDAGTARRRAPGEAWLLPNSFRAALLALAAGARERIGYATDGRGPLLTHRRPPPPRTAHQVRDYDDLLRSRGVAPDSGPPRLDLSEAARETARAHLAAAGIDPSARPVLLAPGAAWSWTKRWPPERFGRLAAHLAAAGTSVAVAIGPGEEDLARGVTEAAGASIPVLGASLDPVELAALFSLARVVIANDSGPMHLAAAVGTPVIALFGPTDPGRTGPEGSPARVLDRYLFCSPCFLAVCPYGHECLRGIGPEDVLRALEGLGDRIADLSLRSG